MPFRVFGTLYCVCLFVREVRVIYSYLWKQRIRILVFWLEWALIKRFPYSFRIRKSFLWGLYAFPKHIDFPGRTAKPQESNRPTERWVTQQCCGCEVMQVIGKSSLEPFNLAMCALDQITPPLQTVSSC